MLWRRARSALKPEPLLHRASCGTAPCPACSSYTSKEREDVSHNSFDRSCAALGRRPAELALQPQLGLCAQRPPDLGGRGHRDPGDHGAALTPEGGGGE